MRPLAIERLFVRSLRNLSSVEIAPSPRFNVLAGDNGQGKTNLLEAVYAVATSRSFRATRPADLVAHDGEVASVRALVREDQTVREQSVGFRAGARLTRLDGKRPPSLAAYAVRTPVVVFHPGETALTMGGGSERRRLLDRLALYVSPGSLSAQGRYTRALRARQRSLETRGTHSADLDAWEALLVQEGRSVMAARSLSAAQLATATEAAFARIAAPDLALDVAYAPGAPTEDAEYREALRAGRLVDLRRGSARVGPHKDDLTLRFRTRRAAVSPSAAYGPDQPVRGVASQGQHRAVVLALKSAEVAVIGEARGAHPILLLDDVSSELDRGRTAALFEFLAAQHGQVFLTTTRRELIDLTGDGDGSRRDFDVRAGGITPA